MTRRCLNRILVSSAVGASACSTSSRDVRDRLERICRAGDFEIIGARLGLNRKDALVPWAIYPGGALLRPASTG